MLLGSIGMRVSWIKLGNHIYERYIEKDTGRCHKYPRSQVGEITEKTANNHSNKCQNGARKNKEQYDHNQLKMQIFDCFRQIAIQRSHKQYKFHILWECHKNRKKNLLILFDIIYSSSNVKQILGIVFVHFFSSEVKKISKYVNEFKVKKFHFSINLMFWNFPNSNSFWKFHSFYSRLTC